MQYKRSALFALGLVLMMGSAQADDTPVVTVDPNDFRKPIPNPEEGLTDKYNDKIVKVSGFIRKVSIDKGTRRPTYELQYDIVQPAPSTSGTKPNKGKTVVVETIVVAVSFTKDPRDLQKDVRARKIVPLTVQGTGHILSDGTLTITDASVVTTRPFSQR